MPNFSLLEMASITKSFAGVTALVDVSFTLARGEVHALVGQNGAGKSTLIKIMTGAYRRDAGRMLLEGRDIDFHSPQQAQNQGVVAVYQEVPLLMHRTVAENILLGREPSHWGRLDWPRMKSEAQEVLVRLGLEVEPTAVLGRLGPAWRQLVAIARALSLGGKVLVLDEPTSSLTEREVASLFAAVARLKAAGVGIVFVSHRLDELYAICDRVTILRDGKLVAARPIAGLPRIELVSLMVGRQVVEVGPPAPQGRANAALPLLRADSLAQEKGLKGVMLEVRRGQVVGLAGLLGSGRTRTARVLFGVEPLRAGAVYLEGRKLRLRSPADAIQAGLALLPEDRRAEGIIPELSVRDNLTLAALPALTCAGVIDRARQRALVERFMGRLGIRASSPDQKIAELSGGNQQKVLLARWLCRQPKVLILDEPTRGIDVGARAEIQKLMGELAESGLGVLLISSDLRELLDNSARVFVLRDGRTVADLSGPDVTERHIVEAMAGSPDAPARRAAG